MALDWDNLDWGKFNAQLPSDVANRILSRAMHEEDVFNSRFNFFLATQTVVIAAYVSLQAIGSWSPLGKQAVPFFGLVLSVMWGYILLKQNYVLGAIRDQAKRLPEYSLMDKCIREYTVGKPLGKHMDRLRIRSMMGYVVPGFFLGIWICLIILTFSSNSFTVRHIP